MGSDQYDNAVSGNKESLLRYFWWLFYRTCSLLPPAAPCYLLVSQQTMLCVWSIALTSTSGTPAEHQQRLLKTNILTLPLWHFLIIGNCLRSFKNKLVIFAHLVQTVQDTVCVSHCRRTSPVCICPYHSLLGSRFQSRLSACWCQSWSWLPGQLSYPYMEGRLMKTTFPSKTWILQL